MRSGVDPSQLLRNAKRAAIFLAAFAPFLLAACTGNEPQSSDGNGTSNTAAPPQVGQVQVAVDSSGGLIAVAGNSVTVPRGALSSSTTVTVSTTTDASLAARFMESSWVVGPQTAVGETELHIDLSQPNLGPGSSMSVALTLSPSLVAQVQRGARVYLAYLNAYSSDDEESGESIDSIEGIPARLDSRVGALFASVPAEAFFDNGAGGVKAILKIVLDTSQTSIGVPPGLVSGLSASGLTVTGWGGCTFPIESANASFLSPLGKDTPLRTLRITAPFNEPGHAGGNHSGTDFQAPEPIGVYAVRGGYIESVQFSTRLLSKEGAGQTVFVRHADGSGTRYLHLTKDSIVDASGVPINLVVDANGIPKLISQENWTESNCANPTFPVSAGQRLATSGDTGAPNRPHLHFEFVLDPKATPYWGSKNPITRLGTLALKTPNTEIGPGPYRLDITTVNEPQLMYATLLDANGSEILVKRKAGVFLPVTARGINFDGPPLSQCDPKAKLEHPSYCNWPVVKVDWDFNSGIGGLVSAFEKFPDYAPTTGDGFNTDSGNVRFQVASLPLAATTMTATVIVTPVGSATTAPKGSVSNEPNFPPISILGASQLVLKQEITLALHAAAAFQVLPTTTYAKLGTIVNLSVASPDPLPPGLVWRSSNEDVATVDGTGVVTGKTEGPVTITATDPASGGSASAKVEFGVFYWRATYTFDACTPLPPDGVGFRGWIWESPCLLAYPRGPDGKFFFDDTSPDVVFETDQLSMPFGVFVGIDQPWGVDIIRSILPIGFKSTDSSFAFSVPSAIREGLNGTVTIAEEGTRQYEFLVSSRTPTSLNGTFSVVARAAYGTGPDFFSDWKAIPVSGSGKWSARLMRGPRTSTRMNGFDFCTYNGFGLLNDMSCGRAPGFCDPRSTNIFPAFGCVFGSPDASNLQPVTP